MNDVSHDLLATFQAALQLPVPAPPVALPDGGSLTSIFAVSDLAQASVGVAGSALAALVAQRGDPPDVSVDRDLASVWFRWSIRPQGWEIPPPWDAVSGDYLCQDGWIRLHANAPHHRAAILAVLDVPAERDEVAAAARSWPAHDLESAVVGTGGAAAAMRSEAEWRAHPQGRAVAIERLVSMERTSKSNGPDEPAADVSRPLEGLRVLDLTRVLAGPVATRLLAGWGADVLRVDPLDWDEPSVAPEVTLGKRCARLDLREAHGKDTLLGLLREADVLVHGYRPGALDHLGIGAQTRDETRPGLVDVSLDAYGWTGPWRDRRGFDSLVQMSTGIADAGRAASGGDQPVPLPVQALDHATGYLLAASVLAGLVLRRSDGEGSRWRLSLARMANVLLETDRVGPQDERHGRALVTPDATGAIEATAWGEARRLAPPLIVEGSPLHWSIPARPLGTDEPVWLAR
jgi:crotonobetainyl-CoA:carnitine CoA-transferase CaiB-like acyl-CoA transferase